MSGAYPEVRMAAATVSEATRGEEERFIATLDQGLPILNDMVDKARAAGRRVLAGSDVFKLYDTYGFPLDLTADVARERGLAVDMAGFEKAIAVTGGIGAWREATCVHLLG